MPEGPDARILRTLGLALRGGHAVVGTRAVRDAAAGGELEVVVLAGDASGNAEDRVRSVLSDPEVRTVRCADGASLGRALGRGRVVVAGVTHPGLARKLTDGAEAGSGAE